MNNAFPISSLLRLFLTAATALAASTLIHADEGMWLYNQPPHEILRQRHSFEASADWLEHLQKSSVRFMSGGSGSFVSEDGLVLSNHHVGADAIQKLSTQERDLLRDGFHAGSLAEELPCKDLELNVLMEIEDVTARVNAAVPATLAPEQAATARRGVLAEIEQESVQKTGMRSDVVTLFQGGAYHLYRYKRYTDVRLVFAPEQQIAFFGGDPDNFEYPRFCLDIAFFRAYEDGKPAKTPHFLRWSTAGSQEGDLVFVSGHPGRTSRLLTVSELEYLRDRSYPEMLERLNRAEVNLQAWSGRSAENARRAKDELFGVQNSRKARIGGLAGLQDPAFFGRIVEAETAFRARLSGSTEFEAARDAYQRIAEAQQRMGEQAIRYRMLEAAWGLHSELFSIARTLLRASEEYPKASRDRLREFRDSNRTSLELRLFSTQPIHADLETVLLTDSLTFLTTRLGASDPLLLSVLAGKSPRARAAELIGSTKVGDVATRRRLYEGGATSVASAADPMIELARTVDAEARALRKLMEEQDEVKQQAHAAIAKARFALQGSGTYPDATFTLRLTFGTVKSYAEDGQTIPAFTDLGGLYARSEAQSGQPPFDLPQRWIKRRSRLALDTPFNFVSTVDIIGGNSGSPVVNRAGEFVGIIFDGNLSSLVLDFAFDDLQARALSVDSRGILEALRRVYDARALVDELTGRRGIRR
jgi:hypothetical protein